jgi:lipopolysaccharide biosynthesis glycosyltransferase
VKRLHLAFARQDWSDAERQLASFADEECAANLELRVKRFEYLCFTRDLKGAAEALKALGPLLDLPAHFVPAVLRFYGETNAWRELYELGIARLEDSFDYQQTGYILFRAIRKTRSHLTALTEIERIEGWETIPSLRKLRTIVMEDLAHNGDMLDEIRQDPNAEYTEALQNRLFFKMRVLRGPNAGKDYAIYYCSNDSYFCATAVSITSLVENNRELMADATLFVAVDDHLVPFASTVLNKLAGALGVEIHVLAASALVRENVKFDVGYGLFTGGHSLADAAYYRIYMARHLMEQKSFERALYIDSDTIVLPGLERLFWMKSQHPLMARLEDDRPEVQTAIRLHGLQPGRYFNSGVLQFDLRNRDVRSGLERTMRAIADPDSKLLFHDQCALNIGFAGAFSPLRQEFNRFIRLDTAGDVDTGIIVHFLDRPKPWDPAYPAAICRLWYTYWHKLSGHVGSHAALEMYRAANKD